MNFDDIELSFRDFRLLKNYKYDEEKVSTVTSRDQIKTESSIEKCFDRFHNVQYLNPHAAKMHREDHLRYLESMLQYLPTNYECLDSSRPWNVYWILQAAQTLEYAFNDELLKHVVEFLIKCRHPNGGFGGGPGQNAHLAPTYAAVNALCIIGTPAAYAAIDRDSLARFLHAVREPDGSFRLHVDGETDVRGAYCAISCAKLTNMPKEVLSKLFEKTGDWLASCQTYEGGFGGAPDLEAHGGYTFCGIAGLALLNEAHKCDVRQLLRWTLKRQMIYEGGFQGRTQKLVDGCYTFWVGASAAIAQAILSSDVLGPNPPRHSLIDAGALQEYILLCCQRPNGGLLDKPGKPADLYHTCYTLTGMSIAQHAQSSLHPCVLGDPVNELVPTHPLFNIPPKDVSNALRQFEDVNRHMQAQKASPSPANSQTTEHNNGIQGGFNGVDKFKEHECTPSDDIDTAEDEENSQNSSSVQSTASV